METMGKVAIAIVVAVMVRWGWKLRNWVWLKPKKLEKWLRDEGYKGNSYKLLMGDMIELATMVKEGKSKPIPVTHEAMISLHMLSPLITISSPNTFDGGRFKETSVKIVRSMRWRPFRRTVVVVHEEIVVYG
ncbi:hypothetical protein L1987_10997 [Smallanthus sonchifolius]|uniref:Uncharacterized protein n=1 Tax=Smallanthus sonchifolius TaxID=185202 RepID=A0ACB9J9R0_9ASTR|nr:hypothetical protein L1987_10997 [Smallanthus sonchifolius]